MRVGAGMGSWALLVKVAGVSGCVGATVFGCGGSDPSTGGTSSTSSGGGGGGEAGAGGGQTGCVVDGMLAPTEECDDGNGVDGDGCDSDCSFSCAADSVCDDADPCNGAETCTDQHTCQAGTPPPDGAPCGQGQICKGGACGEDVCGDAFVSAGEACDDGNDIDGDGCDDCQFSCESSDPVACPPASACEGAGACDDTTHTCAPGAPLPDGTPCGAGSYCSSGVCMLAVCGNGLLEMGEQCDFGPGNGAGTGCEATCAFSCTMAPDSCPDANLCNGTEVCAQVMVNAQVGQACSPGVALPACAPCPGGVCGGGACLASTCGDGCLDPGNGEQCEPPGSSGCTATCTNPNCGNGVREGAEQCDDGNLTNLDGCDAACSFEQNERMSWFKLQFAADAYCTANALGAAFVSSTARNQFQQSLDSGVANGAISVMFKITGLDDLTGANDPVVELGTVSGAPETNGGMLPYDGTNDLDWWYNVDPASIDANRNPTAFLPASMTAGVMNAGPGPLLLTLVLLGSPAPLQMSNVHLNVTIGSTGAPLASAGAPPGHLASENLDPALVSYVGAGERTASGSGKLCGNISALSLSQVPIPPSLAAGGSLPCSQGYTLSNSMLDLLVSGCTVFFPQIAPSQPDQQNPDVAPVGAGAPYTLQANAQRVVTTCLDSSGQAVDLAECLEDAAFSSFFKFATSRVIVK